MPGIPVIKAAVAVGMVVFNSIFNRKKKKRAKKAAAKAVHDAQIERERLADEKARKDREAKQLADERARRAEEQLRKEQKAKQELEEQVRREKQAKELAEKEKNILEQKLAEAKIDDEAIEPVVREYKTLGQALATHYEESVIQQKEKPSKELLEYSREQKIVPSQIGLPQLSERQYFLLDKLAGCRSIYQDSFKEAFIAKLSARVNDLFEEGNAGAAKALKADLKLLESVKLLEEDKENKAANLLMAMRAARKPKLALDAQKSDSAKQCHTSFFQPADEDYVMVPRPKSIQGVQNDPKSNTTHESYLKL